MKFQEIPGKQEEKQLLTRIITSDSMPHAMMFAGSTGSGQLAMAIAAAAYILCENPSTHDSCGECRACRKTKNLAHPDLHFAFPVVKKADLKRAETTSADYLTLWRSTIAKEPFIDINGWINAMQNNTSQANINKKECVEIIKSLSLKPFEAENKVVILWMPEYLRQEGNRLLKAIEEPTPGTYFFLVADNPAHILNTIVSRTQLLTISPFSPNEIENYLKEKYNAAQDHVQHALLLAENNIYKAIEIVSQSTKNYHELFITWLRNAYTLDPKKILSIQEQILQLSKNEIQSFIDYGIYFIRNIVLEHLGGHIHKTLNSDLVSKMSKALSLEACEHSIALLERQKAALNQNANPKIQLMANSIEIGALMRNINQPSPLF